MKNQIIIGVHNLDDKTLEVLATSFDKQEMIEYSIDDIGKFPNVEIAKVPDVLLINFEENNLYLVNNLRDICRKRFMVLATLGNNINSNIISYNFPYSTYLEILMTNNVINNMALSMRQYKSNTNTFDFVKSEMENKVTDYIRRKQTPEEYIEAMKRHIAFIEMKDHYTKGHCERATNYATVLAKYMQLPEEDISVIQDACIIHDVGKIALPLELLTKEGNLSSEEYELIKLHTNPDIIAGMLPENYFSMVKQIITCHHERYDGNGYPNGLIGDSIPLLARILSVVDSFDAMTTRRSYNLVKSLEDAKKEIINNAGTQFDPLIANLFAYLLENDEELKNSFYQYKESLETPKIK